MVAQIPNEAQLRRIQVGTEAFGSRGTAVAPTTKWYGDLAITKTYPLADRNEYDGSFDGWITPVRGPVGIGGTYGAPLSYEDYSIYLRYGVKGQVPGVSDGNGTPGYAYTYQPTPGLDDLDSFIAELGHIGNPWLATELMFNTFTISADVDDTEAIWKWASDLFGRTKDPIANQLAANTSITSATSTVITKTGAAFVVNAFTGNYVKVNGGTGAGQVRLIASNTATTITVTAPFNPVLDATSTIEIPGAFTAAIADRGVSVREAIDAPGTALYIDNAGGTIGTTPVLGKFISFSVTQTNNINPKRYMEDVGSYNKKVGRGMRQVTGQVRMEFDDHAEYDKWTSNVPRLIRIQKTGSQINASPLTNKYARIDLPAAYWDVVTEDVRDNNITATFGFKGYKDTTLGYSAKYEAKHKLATLP
jgi:hypothetical protein